MQRLIVAATLMTKKMQLMMVWLPTRARQGVSARQVWTKYYAKRDPGNGPESSVPTFFFIARAMSRLSTLSSSHLSVSLDTC